MGVIFGLFSIVALVGWILLIKSAEARGLRSLLLALASVSVVVCSLLLAYTAAQHA